jgi:GLPGLI family protein
MPYLRPLRTTTLLLSACFSGAVLHAQQPAPIHAQQPAPVPVLAIATYRFSQLEDTANPASLHTEYTSLFIGRTESLYQRAAAGEPPATASTPASASAERVEIDDPASFIRYYCSPANHELVANQKMFFFNYIFDVTYPDIAWQISADTATVGGFRCQVATGRWRGRLWTVCFCPELPFRYGPWKLNGLPGLILQAADSTNQVSFTFDGFRRNDDPGLTIRYPTDHPVRLSEKEFNRLHRLFSENPRAYLETYFGPQGMNSVSVDPSFRGEKKISNPIELGSDN